MHLGTKSLRRLLAQEIHYPENFCDRTFHWGDVLYETDVGDSGGGLGRRLRRPVPLISADAAAATAASSFLSGGGACRRRVVGMQRGRRLSASLVSATASAASSFALSAGGGRYLSHSLFQPRITPLSKVITPSSLHRILNPPPYP